MRIAKVTGTLTASIRSPEIAALKFLVVDIIDAAGKLQSAGHIALNECGAGVGDRCILVEGSSARLTQSAAGKPVDAVLTAIIDTVQIGGMSA